VSDQTQAAFLAGTRSAVARPGPEGYHTMAIVYIVNGHYRQGRRTVIPRPRGPEHHEPPSGALAPTVSRPSRPVPSVPSVPARPVALPATRPSRASALACRPCHPPIPRQRAGLLPRPAAARCHQAIRRQCAGPVAPATRPIRPTNSKSPRGHCRARSAARPEPGRCCIHPVITGSLSHRPGRRPDQPRGWRVLAWPGAVLWRL
jgi:hypothetical protein